MKILNIQQMEENNGGANLNGCAAAVVGGIGLIAVSGITGGLGLFLGGIFFGGSVQGLKDCVS